MKPQETIYFGTISSGHTCGDGANSENIDLGIWAVPSITVHFNGKQSNPKRWVTTEDYYLKLPLIAMLSYVMTAVACCFRCSIFNFLVDLQGSNVRELRPLENRPSWHAMPVPEIIDLSASIFIPS